MLKITAGIDSISTCSNCSEKWGICAHHQDVLNVSWDGTPMQVMTEDRAYQVYENYVKLHRATNADPLRTFSGWLQQMSIKTAEEH